MPMKPRIMNPPRDLGGGWMEGFIGKYKFQAKVYDEPSEYGIKDGRVSKLCVYDDTMRLEKGMHAASIIEDGVRSPRPMKISIFWKLF